jgi:hypothetical protein
MEDFDGDESPPVKGGERVAGDDAGDDAAAGDNDYGVDDDTPSASVIDDSSGAIVLSSTEGIKFYSRNDVLCGRGGGTNVHPGNRRFRDLINGNRLAYLKARKNDKPDISRSIVRTIRDKGGRFLKRDGKRDLWFEIGDEFAREKTAQALRQRAPEMRKVLLSDERLLQQQHDQQQQQERHRAQHDWMQRRQHELMIGMGWTGGQGMGGNDFPRMNMGGGVAEAPGDDQNTREGGNSDLTQQSFFAMMRNNTTNWITPEQYMILQQLNVSGMNPQSMNLLPENNQSQKRQSRKSLSQNCINDMTSHAPLQHGMTTSSPRGA